MYQSRFRQNSKVDFLYKKFIKTLEYYIFPWYIEYILNDSFGNMVMRVQSAHSGKSAILL